jgi:hypothetical protein
MNRDKRGKSAIASLALAEMLVTCGLPMLLILSMVGPPLSMTVSY